MSLEEFKVYNANRVIALLGKLSDLSKVNTNLTPNKDRKARYHYRVMRSCVDLLTVKTSTL